MRVQSFLSAAIAVGICAWATSIHGAVIYSQTTPEEPVASFSSSHGTDISQKIADNFVVDGVGGYTVRSLRVIGSDGTTLSQPDLSSDQIRDDFRVTFLNDAAGIPGTPVDQGVVTIDAVLRTPTGGTRLNGEHTPVEFILDFGNGVALEHGTEYWISVTNEPYPTGSWSWARAIGVLDQRIAAQGGGNFPLDGWRIGSSSGGMWFELSTHNVIPEPTSLFLLAPALCWTWWRTRR